MDAQRLRDRYRPRTVRVLFIGESPPAGEAFFYAENSSLYRATQEAFCNADAERFGAGVFLERCREAGCFLDDLCLKSVNQLKRKGAGAEERQELRKLRRQGIEPLARRIRTADPKAIVVVLAAIEDHVRQAALRADVPCPRYVLPFPVMHHRRRYVEELARLVRMFANEGTLTGSR